MMLFLRPLLPFLLALAFAPGQQLLWGIPAVGNASHPVCYPFSDFNHDGIDDILVLRYVLALSQATVLVVSGLNGAILHQHPIPASQGMQQAGDFDGDGYDEYIWLLNLVGHVYSPHRNMELFTLPPGGGLGAGWGFGWATEARIDLDGNGLGDMLIASTDSRYSVLEAFDHQGNLRYSIPALSYGWLIRKIVNVGDRDGDGGEDFLVGALGGAQSEGGAFLFSGRTGTLLRHHFGLQPFDLIGGFVVAGGDLDRDGVDDYLAANEVGSGSGREITIAWSGATGAVIRVWQDPNYQLGFPISAKHDIDLDGVPDVLFGCPACRFPCVGCTQPGVFRYGSVQYASSRDGWILQETHSDTGQANYGRVAVDMGIQPGNPHPVHALTYTDLYNPYQAYALEVWRSEPVRSSLTGTACSTAGPPMVPGLRPTATGSRLQLANAPPGALAWCILGDGNATTTSGLPLPVALDPYGFAGCSLNVPLDFVGTATTGTVGIDRGYAAFDLPVALAAIGGRRFAVQWLVLDPSTGLEVWTKRRNFWVQ